ncbi:MAG: host attachment family protein [Rhodospirillales bacterium]
MTVKPVVTWVVVADGSKARVFTSPGSGRGLSEVPDGRFDRPHHHEERDFSDRPGRVQDSHGPGRHAVERVTDPGDQARQILARAIAKRLDAALSDGAFDRLALVAAPKMLAQLRAELSEAGRARVVCELSKDLTEAKGPAIAKALESHLLV